MRRRWQSFWPRSMLAVGLLITLPHAAADSSLPVAATQFPPILLAQANSAQSASRPDARAMVQLMNQLDGLNLELNKLRGNIENLSNSILNAEKRQKDMYLDLDTRLRRIEQSNAEALAETAKVSQALAALRERVDTLEKAAANTSADAGSAPGAGNEQTNAGARAAYDAAMQKYRAGEFQDAISAFREVVEKYPRHPLSINARYWIGDAFYQLRAYRSAIDVQRDLIARYPNSPKTPDAMLNIGSALVGLRDVDGARQAWERLIAAYPETRAAENARARLQRLP